jgi:GMP synthase (glutamine-hydrolysing)
MKILLLQARHANDRARLEERHSFAPKARLKDEQIVPFDLLSGTLTLTEIRKYDALMIGGSGEYYVSKKNLPSYQVVLDVIREVVSMGHPMFASCFGFHLLIEALGGNVIYDPDHMEVGTYQLTLAHAGEKDELFSYLPSTFQAQLGHKDRAGTLPAEVVNLAASEYAPYQALRIPDKPIWSTQFHPELTGEENLERFNRYLEGYANMMSEEEMQETLNRFKDSPETDQLIERFLKLVFG